MIDLLVQDRCQEELLSFFREAEEDLNDKRERFTAFLQMSEDELRRNPEFVKFLVNTTDELIDSAARLNSLAKEMAAIRQA